MREPTYPDRVWGAIRYHGLRWLPMFGLAALTYVLYPVPQGTDVRVPAVGEVADEDILAPFDFVVVKSDEDIEREATELAARARPIYEFRDGVADSLLAVSQEFFDALRDAGRPSEILDVARRAGVNLTGEEAQYLADPAVRRRFQRSTARMITGPLATGVTAPGTIEQETVDDVVVRRDETERTVAREDITTFARYIALDRFHPDPGSSVGDQVFIKILSRFFAPTLVRNESLTEARRAALRAQVDSVKYQVRANERIVAAHEVITSEVHDKVLALRAELLRRGGGGGRDVGGVVGQILTNAVVLTVFWLLLTLYLPDTYASLRMVGTVSLLFALVIVTAALNFRFVHEGSELIPVPFAAIVITMLLNGRIAIVAAMVLALLVGFQAAYGANGFYIAVLGGVAAALSARRVRRRTHILASALLIAVALALAALTVALRVSWPVEDLLSSILRGTANATVSASVAFLALPIFEALARVTTDVTLLELADPTRPLLRRLATEIPGTYAHSVAVANLAEAASNAIGANGLLARVGCYYHDIGKLHRPAHFSENQGSSGNPHDRLPPDVSAGIIRDHVTEGMKLAEEARLPPVVRAFIPEHHGTREITYFLDRARKAGEVSPEDLAGFRYPGPKPQSRETAIAMLADGVEAVIRVLDDPSLERVRDAIDHVVRQRLEEGQLDEAPLTLGQLRTVREAFLRTLSGMYHNRIEYPAESGGITAHWSAASGA